MTSVVPNSSASSSAIAHAAGDVRGIWKVIAASSVGTMIEWYDFYIFGSWSRSSPSSSARSFSGISTTKASGPRYNRRGIRR